MSVGEAENCHPYILVFLHTCIRRQKQANYLWFLQVRGCLWVPVGALTRCDYVLGQYLLHALRSAACPAQCCMPHEIDALTVLMLVLLLLALQGRGDGLLRGARMSENAGATCLGGCLASFTASTGAWVLCSSTGGHDPSQVIWAVFRPIVPNCSCTHPPMITSPASLSMGGGGKGVCSLVCTAPVCEPGVTLLL